MKCLWYRWWWLFFSWLSFSVTGKGIQDMNGQENSWSANILPLQKWVVRRSLSNLTGVYFASKQQRAWHFPAILDEYV